jgi:hypothetical protein
MNLPDGVVYHPNARRLCGADKDCRIQVPPGYEQREVRVARWLAAYWGAWPAFRPNDAGPAYARAWNAQFQIEIVPQTAVGETASSQTLLAARIDRFPSASSASPLDRICEFQTFGMALIDTGRGFLDLWVAKVGDKILVPSQAYCALYGLGETLITLELCNGAESAHSSDWRERIQRSGPPMLGWYNAYEAVFQLNRTRLDSLSAKPSSDLQVRILRDAGTALAPFLYRQLTRNLDLVGQLYSLGVRLHQASREAILPEDPRRNERFPVPVYLSGLLKNEVPGRSVMRSYLFAEEIRRDDPPPPWPESFVAATRARVEAAKQLVDLTPGSVRPFIVVIEGTGEWTERCYRPAVLEVSQKAQREIKVFYVNDETWKAAPPWSGSPHVRGKNGERWLTEAYWDKSNPDHQRLYKGLNAVDAVFVVTPDVTHAEIAKHWLGKTPVIFVEKPFDTEAERFDGLLYAMALSELGGAYKTAVVGIDHYLMRLTPLFAYLAPIAAALAGLKGTAFEMTESKTIEPGREKTLALGLGMDLLPHFVALLQFLGPLQSIDAVRVLRAIQYRPLDRGKFDNETGLAGDCGITDYVGAQLTANFCAGKGIKPAFKRLLLQGASGDDVLIDFAGNTVTSGGTSYQSGMWGTEFAYKSLMFDLYNGQNTILSTCLNVSEAEQIVRFLDQMWRATQWIKLNRRLESVEVGTRICPAVQGATA